MGLKGPESSVPWVDKDAIKNEFAECKKEPRSGYFKNEDIKQETAGPNLTKAKKKRKNKRDLDKLSDLDVKKIKKEPLTDPEMPEGSAIQEHGINSNKLKIKLNFRKRQVKSSEGLIEREDCLGGNGENALGMHFLATMDLTDRDEAEKTHDGMAAVESTKSYGKRKYKKSGKYSKKLETKMNQQCLVSEPHSSPEPLTQNEMDQRKNTVDIKAQLTDKESFMAPFPKNSMKYVAVTCAMNSPALSEKQDTCIGCPDSRCSASGNFAESTCVLWRSKGSDHWDRSYCHKCRLCDKYVKQADLDTHFTSQHSEVGCVVGYFEQVIEKEWRTNAEKWIEYQQGEVHRCRLCKTSVNQTSEEISDHLDFSHYGVSLGYYYQMYIKDALSNSVSKSTAKCDFVDSKSNDWSPQNPPLADQVNLEVPLQSHIPCSTEPLTAINEVIWSPANENDWFWQNSQSYIPHEPDEGKTKSEKRVNDVHDTNFAIPKNWPSMYSFKNGNYSSKQLLSAKKFYPSQRKNYFRSVGLTKEESEFILKKIAREESNESKEVEMIDEEESEFAQEGFVPGAANCTEKNSYYGPNYANLYCDPRERLQEVEIAKPKKAYRHSLTKDKLKESKYNPENPIDANQSFHGSIPELTNVWVDCDNSALIEAGDFNASDSGIGSPGSDHFSWKPVDPNESLATDEAMMNQGLTEDQSHSEKPEESFVEEFGIDLIEID